jgi:hypothetical protein
MEHIKLLCVYSCIGIIFAANIDCSNSLSGSDETPPPKQDGQAADGGSQQLTNMKPSTPGGNRGGAGEDDEEDSSSPTDGGVSDRGNIAQGVGVKNSLNTNQDPCAWVQEASKGETPGNINLGQENMLRYKMPPGQTSVNIELSALTPSMTLELAIYTSCNKANMFYQSSSSMDPFGFGNPFGYGQWGGNPFGGGQWGNNNNNNNNSTIKVSVNAFQGQAASQNDMYLVIKSSIAGQYKLVIN